MPLEVFTAVILAALMHAIWNAMVRGQSGNGDKTISMTRLIFGQGLWGLPVLLFVPLPPAAAWPYILVSMVLHTGYGLVLAAAYRTGELTQVYPIARGTGPLLVAAASVLFLGETIGPLGLAGIAVICLGLFSIGIHRGGGGIDRRATVLALATGGFIAGYSLCDGLGARIAGGAAAYWAWVAILDSLVFVGLMAWWRSPRKLAGELAGNRLVVVAGGFASYGAYWLVTWAFTQAPIALVSALRETSIIFALLIGVVVLKEPMNLSKVVSTFITLIGAVLIRAGR